jgi:hypothetical protein
MATKDKKKAKKKALLNKRWDRRFVAQSSHNPWIVRVLGAAGAACLGAGGWGYLYGSAAEHLFFDEKLKPIPAYLVAGGAVATGVAIWLGTSAETPIRVGSPGVGVERGEVRRMPWSGVNQITWQSGTLSLVLEGTDEAGAAWTFKVPIKEHPEAVAWILKEAEERVPKTIDVPEEVLEGMPRAAEHAGQKIDLEPLQVVGKKCASSGKTISYEPDARSCARCERVYFKRSVPKKCKCGANLAHLRTAVGQDELDEPGAEDAEDEDARATEEEEAES